MEAIGAMKALMDVGRRLISCRINRDFLVPNSIPCIICALEMSETQLETFEGPLTLYVHNLM